MKKTLKRGVNWVLFFLKKKKLNTANLSTKEANIER